MSAIDFSDPATIGLLTDALTAAGVSGLEISGPGAVAHRRRGEGRGPDRCVRRLGAGPGGDIAGCRQGTDGRPFLPGAAVGIPSRRASAATGFPVDIIGFIRVGPVLLPLRAGRAGILAKRLAEPDALVGFGDPLFEIGPQS